MKTQKDSVKNEWNLILSPEWQSFLKETSTKNVANTPVMVQRRKAALMRTKRVY